MGRSSRRVRVIATQKRRKIVLVQIEQYDGGVLLRIDPASAVPLFEQLAASVRLDASRGVLAAGDRLPAARDVADSLDVNVHTVLRAYQDLRDEGLVDLRRGRGAVVTQMVANYGELGAAIPRLVATARQLGLGASALTAMIRQEYGS